MLIGIFILNLTLFGFLLTYLFKLKFLFEQRIVAGLLIGFIAISYLTLFFSHFFYLNEKSLGISLGLLNFFMLLNILQLKVSQIEEDFIDFKKRFSSLSWQIFGVFLMAFMFLFGNLASELLTYRQGFLYVQPIHAYGDISLHMSIISSFAFGQNFPPQSPILAGTQISYPFLVNFLTAIFVNPLGLSIEQAISLTGVLLIGILIVIFSYFVLSVTGSKFVSVVALTLFFFHGGLGFLYFFEDLNESKMSFLQFFQSLPRDYTALKDLGYWWINVVISMLLPQRSFLLGLPVALLILQIFWNLSEKFNNKALFLGVLLMALLPIIHTHSFIALTPILIWLTYLILKQDIKRLKQVLIFGIAGFFLTLFLVKSFLQQSSNPLDFIQIQVGWMAGEENIIHFYFKNFGFNLILIPVSIIFMLSKYRKLAILGLIGQIWFILPSLLIFQPWEFDNTKLFIYWYLFSVVLIAYFVSNLIFKKRLFYFFISFLLIFFTIFSGILDVTRLAFSAGTRYEIYSPQAIRLSEFIKENISPDAVFLSIDKFDNPVISLAGRKTVLGYRGWIWTYGLDYSQRERDVSDMLAGNANLETFKKYDIGNVILFNDSTEFMVNESYFKENFELIYNQDGYKIFRI